MTQCADFFLSERRQTSLPKQSLPGLVFFFKKCSWAFLLPTKHGDVNLHYTLCTVLCTPSYNEHRLCVAQWFKCQVWPTFISSLSVLFPVIYLPSVIKGRQCCRKILLNCEFRLKCPVCFYRSSSQCQNFPCEHLKAETKPYTVQFSHRHCTYITRFI